MEQDAASPPAGDDLYGVSFAVEVEMQGISLQRARQCVASALPTPCERTSKGWLVEAPGRVWQVKLDGGGPDIVEIASPILATAADVASVRAIVLALAAGGAVATPCTGVHVHVDARQMALPTMVRLAALLARHEPVLYPTLGVHAGRAKYCAPMDSAAVAAMLKAPPTTRADFCRMLRGPWPDRDRGLNVDNILNVSNKETVEFRYFNGTLDPALVGAYVTLVLGMVRLAKASPVLPHAATLQWPGSVSELLSEIGLPDLDLGQKQPQRSLCPA